MARRFHSRRTLTAVSEINLTNMIDLGFVLLIIFMISTPLVTRESALGVQLPVAANAPAREPEARFLEISVDAAGAIRADGTAVTAGELRELLRREAARPNPRVVNVRADQRLPYQRVVGVIDLVQGAGLTKLSLETRPE